MKLQVLIFTGILIFATMVNINAQVSAYSFSQGSGTFSALTTPYTEHTTGTTDYATFTAIPNWFYI